MDNMRPRVSSHQATSMLPSLSPYNRTNTNWTSIPVEMYSILQLFALQPLLLLGGSNFFGIPMLAAQEPCNPPSPGAFFETFSQTCYLLAGTSCFKDPDTGHVGPHSCVPNSVCMAIDGGDDDSGFPVNASVCTCVNGLARNNQGLCYLPFNASCTPKTEDELLDLCDPEQRLACDPAQGRCLCSVDERGEDLGDWIYFLGSSVEAAGCRLKANAKCGRGRLGTCTPHASCHLTTTVDGHGVEDKGLDTYRCVCQEGYVSSGDDGRCLFPHGAVCSHLSERLEGADDYECMEPFVCEEVRTEEPGLARCACPTGTWYDDGTDTCFIRANHSCTVFRGSTNDLGIGLECAPNSECSPIHGSCICNEPLKVNANGHCFLGHGADCESGAWPCDPSAGLLCLHSICECSYGSLYDFSEGKCRALAGSPCKLLPNTADRVIMVEQNLDCVLGAECTVSSPSGSSTCSCTNGTTPNTEGGCYKTYGGACRQGGKDCDPLQHLVCGAGLTTNERAGICGCEQNSVYFNSSRDEKVRGAGGCRLLAGSTCTNPSQNCVPRATCFNKMCTCSEGFVGGLCYPSYGRNCTAADDDGGDHTAVCGFNLDCINGACGCPLGQIFLPPQLVPQSPGCLPSKGQSCVVDPVEMSPTFLSCAPTLCCSTETAVCECAHPAQVFSPSGEDKCVSLVDGRCTLEEASEDNLLYRMDCVVDAECVQLEQDEDVFGSCECTANDTMTTPNRTCAQLSSGGRRKGIDDIGCFRADQLAFGLSLLSVVYLFI